MPSLNTGNAILSNPIKVDSSYNVGIGGAASGSFKLQVTGTTNLTGALSGTSATLSSSLGVNSTIRSTGQTDPASGVGMELFYRAADTSSYIQSYDRTNGAWKDVRIYGNALYFGSQGTNNLTIASTGAATFSSSVNSGQIQATASGAVIQLIGQVGSNAYYVNDQVNNSGKRWRFGHTGAVSGYNSFDFYNQTDDRLVMTLSSGGNVGIGTSNPSELLHLYQSGTVYQIIQTVSGGSGTVYRRSNSATPDWTIGHGAASANENFEVYTSGTGAFTWTMNGGERMRITSSGVVAMNQNTTYGSETLEITNKISGGAQYGILMSGNPASYTNYAMRFHYTGVAIVGSITFNTTSTSYNTSSDYRLKQDLKDFSGLNLVSAIKAYDYEWKEDNSRSYGVLAHELQEIVPYAVNGNKDDKEMQGVDYSKLVPILIKSIQELQAKIVTLESKIN